jgi:hypothetical protein
MKGGTSLRAEGVSSAAARSLSVDSSIDICYLQGARSEFRFLNRVTAPDWPYSVACYNLFQRSETGSGKKRVETTDQNPFLI